MFGFLKSRLGTAIEWRVIREVDREREVIKSLEESLRNLAIEHQHRIAILETLVERLQSEVNDLKTSS